MRNIAHVICLNGPPRSGKDTVANMVYDNFKVYFWIDTKKFSKPLDRIAAATLNIDKESEKFIKYREERKYDPLLEFECSSTMRQMLISISEDYIKPLFGKEWFGKQAANTLIQDLKRLNSLDIIMRNNFKMY